MAIGLSMLEILFFLGILLSLDIDSTTALMIIALEMHQNSKLYMQHLTHSFAALIDLSAK